MYITYGIIAQYVYSDFLTTPKYIRMSVAIKEWLAFVGRDTLCHIFNVYNDFIFMALEGCSLLYLQLIATITIPCLCVCVCVCVGSSLNNDKGT